ncbi:hypothetical protein KUTeg_006836 [Tegillarca granosa]|uniref:Beta-lactamase-related domain-containing protein n=1 Tax=Tegillarca granosa TaxID=220873 RepID=A0ABQ9FDG1_TEGGR|nr:hypothetical protein KUTeg_006836 [Tegillarca granosa]
MKDDTCAKMLRIRFERNTMKRWMRFQTTRVTNCGEHPFPSPIFHLSYPRTDFAYHALTFGFFVDNLIMKADPKHRKIDRIFREEIAEPYGIDLMISAPSGENYRIARMNPITLNDFILGSLLSMHMHKHVGLTPAVFNDPSIRDIPLSSNMGFGNARSIAKFYGILANNGKLGNKTMLSRKMIKDLATEQSSGTSKDLGIHITMAKGVFIVNNTKDQPVFGHPGYGGQMAFADVHNEIGMAYVTNHLSIYAFGNDPNFLDLQRVFYECFDKFKFGKN